VGSALVAIVMVAVVARLRLPEPSWAPGWLGLEPATHALVVRPTLRAAELLARFDDRGLDRAVDRAAGATLRLARGSASVDARAVDGAVEALARWVRRLGRLARRPQTGQLFHYYLQAAAVVAAGLVLLVTLR
jgi:hypothetical protein